MKQYINRDKIYVEDLGKYANQVVSLYGWLYNKRGKGKLAFLLLRDGTGIVQCVMSKGDVGEEIFNSAAEITQESAIKIIGKVNADERAPGGFEIHVQNFELVSKSQEYPITPKEHGTTFLMDHRHLWLRSKKQNAILRIRHTIIKAIRDFFDGEGFTLIDAPIFTPAACEGTSTLFETDYFEDKAYLTQSGQLYMEAGAMAFGKVYCFGPTFRAEKSKTRRHLTEFWMVEPEVAFMDLDGDMELAENFVSYIARCVLEKNRRELQTIERDISKLESIKAPFPRLHYDEAAEILKKENTEFIYGDDFGALDETVISSQFDRPVMVHRYPGAVKAFYMKEDPEDKSRALGFDMLAPEGYGEVIGGGQREDDLDVLLAKIKEHDLPQEAFNWYLDLRRYGSVPHAGFGLGVERTVAWLCGLHHVRETIPFARLMHRLTP